jgi:hypothetical protein
MEPRRPVWARTAGPGRCIPSRPGPTRRRRQGPAGTRWASADHKLNSAVYVVEDVEHPAVDDRVEHQAQVAQSFPRLLELRMIWVTI